MQKDLLFFFALALLECILASEVVQQQQQQQQPELRVVKVKVADVEHAGMNGGHLHVNAFGGGEFSIKMCNEETGACCDTGDLNTKDDNWERGELNYFVGRQLGGCEDFPLSEVRRATLEHRGPNGGQLEYVELMDATAKDFGLHCPVGVKLDNDDRFQIECALRNDTKEEGQSRGCNGDERFCKLRFDELTFPGSHNAGTGQASRAVDCFFKNQDLNIVEQLDFGIRFFDLDIIYSTSLTDCHGLETGHGKFPSVGLYQCFGSLDNLFSGVRDWLARNPREVVILYFGEIIHKDEAYPALVSSLRDNFKAPYATMNEAYKKSGGQHWPTLGEAVEANSRVFVFIRSDKVTPADLDFVREVQVSDKKDEGEKEPAASPLQAGEVTILSTYHAKKVGSECSFVVDNVRETCQIQSGLAKLSVFGTPGKGSHLGTECNWDMARKCNRQIRTAVEACLEARKGGGGGTLNFIQVDYANYPANGDFDLVEYCHDLNVRRVETKNN